jgi:hypothetical protein
VDAATPAALLAIWPVTAPTQEWVVEPAVPHVAEDLEASGEALLAVRERPLAINAVVPTISLVTARRRP